MKNFILFLYVKLGFSQLNPIEKVVKARFISTALTGNEYFPTTTPTAAEVKAAADELQTAIDNAQTGDRQMIAIRNQKEAALTVLVGTLQSDINTLCGGDPVKILSAGMEVRSTPSPIGLLGPVSGLVAATSLTPGSAQLSWQRIPKTRLYVVQATNDPSGYDWKLIAETSKSSIALTDLGSSQIYQFRVACITAAGVGPWSDPASCRIL